MTTDATVDRPLEAAHQAEKRFSTLRARFALHGWQLCELADGRLMAARWNGARELESFADAEAMLAQIEGRRG